MNSLKSLVSISKRNFRSNLVSQTFFRYFFFFKFKFFKLFFKTRNSRNIGSSFIENPKRNVTINSFNSSLFGKNIPHINSKEKFSSTFVLDQMKSKNILMVKQNKLLFFTNYFIF